VMARETSPACGMMPPPMRAAELVEWCGWRTGRHGHQRLARRQKAARGHTRVVSTIAASEAAAGWWGVAWTSNGLRSRAGGPIMRMFVNAAGGRW